MVSERYKMRQLSFIDTVKPAYVAPRHHPTLSRPQRFKLLASLSLCLTFSSNLALADDAYDMFTNVTAGAALFESSPQARGVFKTAEEAIISSGMSVRVFMEADPLKPLEAKIDRASYDAAPTPNSQMFYETYARLSYPYALPRIGARGVAKTYGDTAPLIFWLCRRPIAALRQFIGF